MATGSITLTVVAEYEILGAKDITLSVGDTTTVLTGAVLDSDGSIVDLKPVAADFVIRLHLSLEGASALSTDGLCLITGDGSAGVFTYTIVTADSDTEGTYLARFKLTNDSSNVAFSRIFTITFTARMPSS